MRTFRFIALFAALTVLTPSTLAAAPRGFTTVAEAPGVTLYSKRRDFVQVIDPKKGARLHILHGKVLEQGSVVSFTRQQIGTWWKDWSEGNSRAFSVVNGQFFDASDPDIAPLAFSIKTGGTVHEGYGDRTEYPGQKRLLVLDGTRPAITGYTDDPESLLRIRAQNILVGLAPDASKSLARPIPRTFVGVTRRGEILVFSSSMASQASASRVLRMFGADANQMMMLDGGSSSHLVQRGKTLVPADARGTAVAARERLPQIVGVEAGAVR